MAYIGHPCACGHTDLQHSANGAGKSLGRCSTACARPCGPLAAPEVRPTFDAKGRPVERIIPPGEGLRSMGGVVVVRTCPCDACTALYEQVTAPQPA
jgi:hypothetical protein